MLYLTYNEFWNIFLAFIRPLSPLLVSPSPHLTWRRTQGGNQSRMKGGIPPRPWNSLVRLESSDGWLVRGWWTGIGETSREWLVRVTSQGQDWHVNNNKERVTCPDVKRVLSRKSDLSKSDSSRQEVWVKSDLSGLVCQGWYAKVTWQE